MELQPGDKLGPYEIVSAIGRGGMGEVWKARDPRLNRDVAIKTSRVGFSGRFQKEAHSIAPLNHPNVCTLNDVGPDYLVMEFVEGPTLAERILEGAIPLEEALGLSRQIADALEAAHEKTIVHRDLKPANVKVRPDGSVKVLDFGLAKAGAASEMTGDSPTLMSAGTQAGMILGTAGYMSPEQARGQVVDKRADIWAFGVVLYEMVTGKRLFDGATVSDSLAAILKQEPDLTLAPEKTRRLLSRCLEKDPKKRLRDIGDWQVALVEPAATVRSRARLGKTGCGGNARPDRSGDVDTLLPWQKRNHPRNPPDIVTPPTTSPTSFALSPNGRKIAYVAVDNGAERLWVRPLDSISAQLLPGTEGALTPFWSPDSRSLGFFADFKLKRIDLGGEKPQILTSVFTVSGGQGTWSAEGIILFSQGTGTHLYRIPAAGGKAVALTKTGTAPRFLRGQQGFLFATTDGQPGIWRGSLAGAAPHRCICTGDGVAGRIPGAGMAGQGEAKYFGSTTLYRRERATFRKPGYVGPGDRDQSIEPGRIVFGVACRPDRLAERQGRPKAIGLV